MSLLAATLRLLGVNEEVRALDVAVVDGDGAHLTGFDASRPANSVTTTVAVSTTSALAAAANPDRRKLIIYNKSGRTVGIAFEATAVFASAAFDIANNGVWESDLNGYTGDVSAIVASGSGNIRVTEVTT